jgi:hypothetical protein
MPSSKPGKQTKVSKHGGGKAVKKALKVKGGDGVAVHHAQCRPEQASAQARGLPQALHPEGHPSQVRAARVPRPRRVDTNARKPSRVARRRRRQQALFLHATCGASQLPASGRARVTNWKTRFSSKRVFQ